MASSQSVNSADAVLTESPAMQRLVANVLLQKYLDERDTRHLDDAIQLLQGFLLGTDCNSSHFADLVARLGSSSAIRYEATEQTDGFDNVIRFSRQVWQSAEPCHPAIRAACLHYLGLHLGWQHEQGGDISKLEEAVRAERESVRLEASSTPKYAQYLHRLAFDCWKLHQSTGNLAQLDESIELGRQVVLLYPLKRHVHSDNVALRLERRYNLLGDVKDLNEAISYTRQAVEAAPDSHLSLGDYLESLAATLRQRYVLNPTLDDAQEAAQSQRIALELLGNSRSDEANMLFGLGIDLERLYELQGNLCDLDASTEAYQQASELFPNNHTSQSTILASIGANFRGRFEKYGCKSDINNSVQAAREAISRNKPNTSDPEHIMNLALSLGARYEVDKKLEDLDEAIELGQHALGLTNDGDKKRVFCLYGHSENMYRRFKYTHVQEDLEESVELSRRAIAAMTTDDSRRARFSNNLGSRLLHEYALNSDSATLNEAIAIFRDIADTTPSDKEERVIYLINLGDGLLRRYKFQESTKDLDEATSVLGAAMETIPKDHKDRSSLLYSFADALKHVYIRTRDSSDRRAMDEAALELDSLDREKLLRDLYGITGDLAYVDDNIQNMDQMLVKTPIDDPDRPEILAKYSWLLGARFDAVGDKESLKMAIKMAREGAVSSSGNPGQQSQCLYVLGVQLSNEHDCLGNDAALEEAIQVTRQAIALVPESNHHMPLLLNSLGLRLRSHYLNCGKLEVLEEGLRVSKQAVMVTTPTSAIFPAVLNNHAQMLAEQYSLTRQVTALDDAIKMAQQSVRGTPESNAQYPRFCSFLSHCLRMHYERTLEMSSLTEAIRLSREATARTNDKNPDRPDYAICLASCLLSIYSRTENANDLDEAITTARMSANTAPLTHPRLSGMMDTLASGLEARFLRTRTKADIDEAIRTGQHLIDLLADDPFREGFICNQIKRMRTRYSITQNADELDEAIKLGIQGTTLPIRDPQSRAAALFHLGICQAARGEGVDAVKTFQNAWNMADATPQVRVFAAGRCIGLLHTLGRQEEGMKLGFEILALLPTIHTRSLQQSDQQEVMATFAGIASDLCAICIEQGKFGAALRSLEHGRAVIIGQLLSDRTELPQLSKDRPDLARRYESLLWEARAPTSSAAMLTRDNVAKARPRREVVEDLDNCLWEIRAVTGYETFLLPLEHEDMQRCAAGGVVAVVNITSMRSDAILIMNDSVQTLRLPEMTKPEAEKWLARDWAMKKRSEWYRLQQDFSAYLEWLWNVCVKHVVDVIEEAHMPASTRGLPKVWWIGAGYASSMPLHVAGVHTGKSRDNALDRLISSYTPSIKALVAARDQSRRAMDSQDTGSMLIVTMPTTPKAPGTKRPGNLPNVVHEAAEIVNAVGSTINMNVAQGPSVKTTLAVLPTCRIAHFACHGTSDAADPSNSCVILQRQADDGALEQDRLTVRHISGLTMERAQVAYLSACSTAENKVSKLRDEVLHVVSGFQVSGFPHVVGCLWPAGDQECAKVAARFYSLLLREEHGGSPEPCRALHDAVVALRDQDPGMPLLWAQFVHYGW